MGEDLTGVEQQIEAALDQVQAAGVDLLLERRRACAIVADVIADPRVDTRVDFAALRAGLDYLAGARAGADPMAAIPRPAVHEGSGVTVGDVTVGQTKLAAATERMASRLGMVLEAEAASPGPEEGQVHRSWRRPLTAAGSALLLVAAAGAWQLSDGGDGSAPDVSTGSATSAPVSSTTGDQTSPTSGTEPTSTLAPAISAVFDTVREGPYEVTRSWRVTEGSLEIIGIVQVSRVEPGGGSGSDLHTELIPRAAVHQDALDNPARITWTPEPLAQSGTAARFEVGHLEEGQSVRIEFRAPLREGPSATELTVFEWFDTWSLDFAKLTPLGDAERRFEDLVEPRVAEGQ